MCSTTLSGLYHNDDQEEKEDFVFSHVKFASLGSRSEQKLTKWIHQAKKHKRHAQDDVDPVVRMQQTLHFFPNCGFVQPHCEN